MGRGRVQWRCRWLGSAWRGLAHSREATLLRVYHDRGDPERPPGQENQGEVQDDTVGDLKKLVAAQTGTKWEKIRIQKWYTIYKDHITLEDYEIHDGMGLELYYN